MRRVSGARNESGRRSQIGGPIRFFARVRARAPLRYGLAFPVFASRLLIRAAALG